MDEKQMQYPGWRIIRTIGKGSFGCVYEVEKEGAFGAVAHSALKVISIPETDAEVKAYRDDGYDDASLTDLFRTQVEDITAEFQLMSKLKGDSHIVSYEDHTIVQHEQDPGYDIFIRMELLTSLPDYINRAYPDNRIPDAAAIKLGTDICRALERCGRHNIIHRDIKPQNIFVNEEDDFKLGDFGIAKTSDHTTKATKTGTYGYMAPEVYLSKPYNASVDLYSLGLVLYWMLNERRGPFLPLPPAVPRPNQNAEALERRMHGEPLPAPKNGSEELKQIVLKACAFDPQDRYQSPAQMRRDLERLPVGNETATPAERTWEPAAQEETEQTVGVFRTGTASDEEGTARIAEPVVLPGTAEQNPDKTADRLSAAGRQEKYADMFRTEGHDADDKTVRAVDVAVPDQIVSGRASSDAEEQTVKLSQQNAEAVSEFDGEKTVGLFAKKSAQKPSQIKKEPEKQAASIQKPEGEPEKHTHRQNSLKQAKEPEKPALPQNALKQAKESEKPVQREKATEPAEKTEKPDGSAKKKKLLLIASAAAMLVVAAAIVLIVILSGKGKNSEKTAAASNDEQTAAPTAVQTAAPTAEATPKPETTKSPTQKPTEAPTQKPTEAPTPEYCYTEPTNAMKQDAADAVIVADAVNMRTGPGTGYDLVLSGIEKNTAVTLYVQQGDWWFLKCGDHYGYIQAEHLKKVVKLECSPVAIAYEGYTVLITGVTSRGAALTAESDDPTNVLCGTASVDGEGNYSLQITMDEDFYGTSVITVTGSKAGAESCSRQVIVGKGFQVNSMFTNYYSQTGKYCEVRQNNGFTIAELLADQATYASNAYGIRITATVEEVLEKDNDIIVKMTIAYTGETVYVHNFNSKWAPEENIGKKYNVYCNFAGVYEDTGCAEFYGWIVKPVNSSTTTPAPGTTAPYTREYLENLAKRIQEYIMADPKPEYQAELDWNKDGSITNMDYVQVKNKIKELFGD